MSTDTSETKKVLIQYFKMALGDRYDIDGNLELDIAYAIDMLMFEIQDMIREEISDA